MRIQPFRALIPALLLLSVITLSRAQGTKDSDKMLDKSVQTSVGALKYLLFVPKGYTASQRYPLVVSMHGLNDPSVEYINSTNGSDQAHPWIEDSIQARVPHFIMVPQCNSGTWGGMGASTGTLAPAAKSVLEGIESLKKEYSLDTNRFIITGFSIGGAGTYHQIEMKPNYWAAAIPCAAGGDSTKIEVIAKTPIWHHQGMSDLAGAPSIRMMTALENHGHKTFKVVSQVVAKSSSAWRSAIQSGSKPQDIVYKNASPSYDSVSRAIDAGAPFIFLQLTGGDHGAGWINGAHNPLLAKWAFSKVRGMLTTPLATKAGGTVAKRNGRVLTYVFPDAVRGGVMTLLGRRVEPRGLGAGANPAMQAFLINRK
ncbi:MAG: hypothetical protein ABIW76_11170 [Fibrobacteria bacterium]